MLFTNLIQSWENQKNGLEQISSTRCECRIHDQRTIIAALLVIANKTKELEMKTLKRSMIVFVVAWTREWITRRLT